MARGGWTRCLRRPKAVSAATRSDVTRASITANINMANLKGPVVYLLMHRDLHRLRDPAVKIGMSKNIAQRLVDYPKKSVSVVTMAVHDGRVAENALISAFDNAFMRRLELGSEYFQPPGNYSEACAAAVKLFNRVAERFVRFGPPVADDTDDEEEFRMDRLSQARPPTEASRGESAHQAQVPAQAHQARAPQPPQLQPSAPGATIECARCGYLTNRLNNYRHHISRKRMCDPLLSDVTPDLINCRRRARESTHTGDASATATITVTDGGVGDAPDPTLNSLLPT